MFIVLPTENSQVRYREDKQGYMYKDIDLFWPVGTQEEAERQAAKLSFIHNCSFTVYPLGDPKVQVKAPKLTAKSVVYNKRGEYFPGEPINV